MVILGHLGWLSSDTVPLINTGPAVSHSIVVCVSPLTSIMIDQHFFKFSPQGLKTDFVGEAQTDPEAEQRILKGISQLVYISPEIFLTARSIVICFYSQYTRKTSWQL